MSASSKSTWRASGTQPGPISLAKRCAISGPVSTVAGLDAPLKPRELARRQDGYVFAHIDPAERLVTRSQVANATIEEVRAIGDAVSQAASKNITCVFGNREIIEGAKADFTVVDLLGE